MAWTSVLGGRLEYPTSLHARLAKCQTPSRDDVLVVLAEAKKIHDEAMRLNARVVEVTEELQRIKHENEFLLALQQESPGSGGWAGYERRTRDAIGGVLCYTTTGAPGAVGPSPAGGGNFALMIRGCAEAAESAAKGYLKQLQARGHILVHAIFVPNCSVAVAGGSPVQVVSPEDLLPPEAGENACESAAG